MDAQSNVDIAVHKIKEWIVTGKYRPGQKLKEEEIAHQLHISRSPVREAFKMLEAKGLIVKVPRQGVFVKIMTAKDVWEVYSVLASLLELAVIQAMENLVAQDIRNLESHLEKMERCTGKSNGNPLTFQNHHKCFHDIILEKSANSRLQDFASTLEFQVIRFNYHLTRNDTHMKTSIRYHRRILEAIRAQDKLSASKIMKEHVLSAQESFTEDPYFRYY